MRSKVNRWNGAVTFQVTAIIGTVEIGNGDVSPYEAALSLIGKNGGEGSFSFPLDNGDTCHVDICHMTAEDEARMSTKYDDGESYEAS